MKIKQFFCKHIDKEYSKEFLRFTEEAMPLDTLSIGVALEFGKFYYKKYSYYLHTFYCIKCTRNRIEERCEEEIYLK